ncbi:MAG: NfeD family protein [Propionibacteriales bacterium]|nr:NfeD family protein [Propionibacteriales bacterium]
MWDWFGDNPWAVWLAIAVLLAVAELLSMDFVLLMLAFGAAGGAVADTLGASVPLQILAAVAVALGTLMFVRPSVVRRMHGGVELTTGHQALVGRQAVVTEEITPHGGQVKLAGEIWTARPFGGDHRILVGATVDVLEIDGATALVFPADADPLAT